MSLREQLDQATSANQKLSQEIQKVNHEWIRLREQLENREREWREEENVILNDDFVYEYRLKIKVFGYQVSFIFLFLNARP